MLHTLAGRCYIPKLADVTYLSWQMSASLTEMLYVQNESAVSLAG
jgi:hypothetical protein